MMIRSSAVALLLLAPGCGLLCINSRGWIDDDRRPDLTTFHGIRVWLMGGLPLTKAERRGLSAYLDAAHEDLRANGIYLPPAKIGLWPAGALGPNVGGRAIVGFSRCPISLSWYGPGVGPYSFAHEEFHRAGWRHKEMGNPKVAHIIDSIRETGREAMWAEIHGP